ncbi:hypothetical protein [Mycolicibacterium chlorophenolicum]|uniref:Uncharacterized protein n=1 Tax=Mycolicibacterium chlorophenolicum TaxID=37916 RepID=A0A0J6W5H9_9MYCO|nr:hypothetical protein [Mycolicibacterium chlorophenolicum]KMO76867.1 hypothetical protein MCHLDSM_03016 [Mycolicibacterium chlorophenolicum]
MAACGYAPSVPAARQRNFALPPVWRPLPRHPWPLQPSQAERAGGGIGNTRRGVGHVVAYEAGLFGEERND